MSPKDINPSIIFRQYLLRHIHRKVKYIEINEIDFEVIYQCM